MPRNGTRAHAADPSRLGLKNIAQPRFEEHRASGRGSDIVWAAPRTAIDKRWL